MSEATHVTNERQIINLFSIHQNDRSRIWVFDQYIECSIICKQMNISMYNIDYLIYYEYINEEEQETQNGPLRTPASICPQLDYSMKGLQYVIHLNILYLFLQNLFYLNELYTFCTGNYGFLCLY